jgi:hypothetical protein
LFFYLKDKQTNKQMSLKLTSCQYDAAFFTSCVIVLYAVTLTISHVWFVKYTYKAHEYVFGITTAMFAFLLGIGYLSVREDDKFRLVGAVLSAGGLLCLMTFITLFLQQVISTQPASNVFRPLE